MDQFIGVLDEFYRKSNNTISTTPVIWLPIHIYNELATHHFRKYSFPTVGVSKLRYMGVYCIYDIESHPFNVIIIDNKYIPSWFWDLYKEKHGSTK